MFDWLKTSPRLQRRVADLEEEVRAFRSDSKALLSEWNTVYESLKRLEAKLSKRAKRSEGDCGCGKPGEPVAGDTINPSELLKRARARYSTYGR